MFDAYIDHANFAYEHGFRGCGLLIAAAGLPRRGSGTAGRAAAQGGSRGPPAQARHGAAAWAGEAAARVARHLAFLLEGSMARAGLEGEDGCLQEARMIAAQMLEEL